MRVENVSFNILNDSPARKSRGVVNADEIKSILFLGIKSDIPLADSKRKVDIII